MLRVLMFWLFGPRDCFPLKVTEFLIVSQILPSVSNNTCFSVSKMLFRNLSLDNFSNLANICPHAVYFLGGGSTSRKRNLSCRLKGSGRIWLGI